MVLVKPKNPYVKLLWAYLRGERELTRFFPPGLLPEVDRKVFDGNGDRLQHEECHLIEIVLIGACGNIQCSEMVDESCHYECKI